MARSTRRRLRVGDVLALPTSHGMAYAQCTQINEMFGHLLRILSGFHSVPQSDPCSLLVGDVRYCVFFLWDESYGSEQIRVTAHCSVPTCWSTMPLLKDGIRDAHTGKVHNWWLWDGSREWKIDVLDDDHKDLSPRAIWNCALLLKRLESNWQPRDET